MKEWQFWTVTGFGGVLLIVVVVNIFLFLHNRSLQGEVNNRQLYINQSLQLEQLNREIVTALANIAAKNNDEDLKRLLATHGITFSVNPNVPSNTSSPSQTPAKGKR
jgi:Tfp pilus assembly protein PilN